MPDVGPAPIGHGSGLLLSVLGLTQSNHRRLSLDPGADPRLTQPWLSSVQAPFVISAIADIAS